jgi:hypothetical protein
MLGEDDCKQFAKDSQHAYSCTDNRVQAALVNQFNQIGIAKGRIWVLQTALSNSNKNITAFKRWLIKEMPELPPGIAKTSLLNSLNGPDAAWEITLNHPVLKQHQGKDVNVWNYCKAHKYT